MRRIDGLARSWGSLAHRSALARDGVAIAPPLLDADECCRLRDLALSVAARHCSSTALEGDAYVVHRREGPRPYDPNVVQVMNAHLLDGALLEIFESGRVEAMFRTDLGEGVPINLSSITLQIDRPDQEHKRGFHVDAHSPATFKLFTYLTPVDMDDHGPYTVVKGSHRHRLFRLVNIVAARLKGRPMTDMPLYRDVHSTRFHGEPGTTIMSIQSIVHKGWMPHRARDRVVLVCYLDSRRFEKPFSLGREFVRANEIP